jgi:hypothetical protein
MAILGQPRTESLGFGVGGGCRGRDGAGGTRPCQDGTAFGVGQTPNDGDDVVEEGVGRDGVLRARLGIHPGGGPADGHL